MSQIYIGIKIVTKWYQLDIYISLTVIFVILWSTKNIKQSIVQSAYPSVRQRLKLNFLLHINLVEIWHYQTIAYILDALSIFLLSIDIRYKGNDKMWKSHGSLETTEILKGIYRSHLICNNRIRDKNYNIVVNGDLSYNK